VSAPVRCKGIIVGLSATLLQASLNNMDWENVRGYNHGRRQKGGAEGAAALRALALEHPSCPPPRKVLMPNVKRHFCKITQISTSFLHFQIS